MLKTPANGIIQAQTHVPRCSAVNTPGLYGHRRSAALINDNTVPQKICFKCKQIQPLEDFGKDKRTPDGKTGECKTCRRKRSKRAQYDAKYKALHTDEFYKRTLSDDTQLKRCPICKCVLALRNFTKNRLTKDGFQGRCRACTAIKDDRLKRRDKRLQFYYGITLDTYNAMLKKQNSKCAICKKLCASGKGLAVDHSHKLGHVRGLLCRKCNQAIGLLQDNPAIAASALDYLLRI